MIVHIRGTGIAATCCAHLLTQAGHHVTRDPVDRPGVPAILLSDQALALIRDIFHQPSLFADRPRITRRIVAWGDAAPVDVPHGATVVSDHDLAGIVPRPTPGPSPAPTQRPDFTIHTAPPFPSGTPEQFGTRSAIAAQVSLHDEADRATCRIESLPDGWLFLIPGADAVWLLAVGAAIDTLIAQSRLIAPGIDRTGPTSPAFDTCPHLLAQPCGTDWLACGTAAMAFDPICGDGTAQAVREAILASAVITGIAEGGDADALRIHYHSMLLAAMRRHLQLCVPFYRTGGTGLWWQDQAAALMHGYNQCTARLGAMPEPRFALHGLALVPREVAA
jgi:2-polyprenyl-6-methoxyphenol hydroxylase-like FAD-dependent oxidoreductase